MSTISSGINRGQFIIGATSEQSIGQMTRDDAIFGELRIDEKQRDSYYRKALQRFQFGGA